MTYFLFVFKVFYFINFNIKKYKNCFEKNINLCYNVENKKYWR